MENGIRIVTLHASHQNRLNALAEKLCGADRLIAMGEAEREYVRGEFFPLADELGGEESRVIYVAGGKKVAGHRLARQIAMYSDIDVEALEKMVPPEVFAQVTKRVVDKQALDAAIGMGLVSQDIKAACTTIDPRPSLRLSKPSARAKVKLGEGQLAVVEQASGEQEE